MKSDYRKFLEAKIVLSERHGFEVNEADLNPTNFPHQNVAIAWAARLGRALIAASFGLGKTRIQSELARLIHQKTGKKFLVICPLPFDIVGRVIEMYSNPGETVLDPFAGLFTVPVTAMKLNRVGYGIELNPEYYAAGVKYCEATQREKLMPTLFDLLAFEGAMKAEV